MTQSQKILQYMRDFGSITPWEAAEQFGCMRLAARIADLKESGVPIKSEMKKGKNKYGENIRYASYRLEE